MARGIASFFMPRVSVKIKYTPILLFGFALIIGLTKVSDLMRKDG